MQTEPLYDDPDQQDTIKLHDEYDGSVTGVATVACTDFGNNRVSLRLTDPATGRSTWAWMTAQDAALLGHALTTCAGVAGPEVDGDDRDYDDSSPF